MAWKREEASAIDGVWDMTGTTTVQGNIKLWDGWVFYKINCTAESGNEDSDCERVNTGHRVTPPRDQSSQQDIGERQC